MTDKKMPEELDAELLLDANAQVGEGPLWDDMTATLIWVDIMGNTVHRYDPSSRKDHAIDVGQPVGAAVPRADGPGLMLALRDGFGSLDESSGAVEVVVPVEEHLTGNRMNDGKCDPRGRFWAGTMGFAEGHGVGSLYRLDPDLSVHHMLTDVTISNGLDWTDDGRRMYYIDTRTRGVDVFDFDMQTGSISERRRLITFEEGAGAPDGMTLDADGALWVAVHSSGTVRCYTPDGVLSLVVRVPGVAMVTSCAFGGPELTDLYITTMQYGMSAEAKRSQPLSGALFHCRPGARGRRTNRFGQTG
jgi:sugar lactone lactonase YvrE